MKTANSDSIEHFIVQDGQREGAKQRKYNCFTPYIRRKLRAKHPGLTISALAVHEIDNLLKDVMDKIGECAADLLQTSDRFTINPYNLARACKLALPPRLCANSGEMGLAALLQYRCSFLPHRPSRYRHSLQQQQQHQESVHSLI